MDTDTLQRHWEQAKSRVRTKWDKLTDDDVLFINGSSQRLCKKLVARYGFTQEQAREKADELAREVEAASATADTREAGGTLRESSPTNPGGAQGIHPPRNLDDGLRDALGGGGVAAGDF